MPLSKLEVEREKCAREAQGLLLEAHVDARGPGDVGPSLVLLAMAFCRLDPCERDAIRKFALAK